jgi:hypothetical protein
VEKSSLTSLFHFLINFHLLHDPDSIKTGTNERPLPGMFIGLERAGRLPTIVAPISTDSMSIAVRGDLEDKKIQLPSSFPSHKLPQNSPARSIIRFEHKLWPHPQSAMRPGVRHNFHLGQPTVVPFVVATVQAVVVLLRIAARLHHRVDQPILDQPIVGQQGRLDVGPLVVGPL